MDHIIAESTKTLSFVLASFVLSYNLADTALLVPIVSLGNPNTIFALVLVGSSFFLSLWKKLRCTESLDINKKNDKKGQSIIPGKKVNKILFVKNIAMITFFSVRTKNLLVKEILAGNFFHFQIISTHDYFSAPQYFASIWKHTTFICFTCLDQWAIFLSEAKKIPLPHMLDFLGLYAFPRNCYLSARPVGKGPEKDQEKSPSIE